MISYILNFILCSGLLLLVYRVFLQGENLYKFNRFYLLFSLVFSLIVPLFTVTVPAKLTGLEKQFISETVPVIAKPVHKQKMEQQSPVVVDQHVNEQAIATELPIPTEISTPVQRSLAAAPTYNYLPLALGVLYLVAALIMLARFIRNGYHIKRTVSLNPVVEYDDTKLVLLNEQVTPHSFLKYVFINKKEYSDGSIEPEIICHEQTHVRQLHSLDIILVELIQAVYWFNPLIPFYRKAIQLNHEFLADEAVIKNYHNTPAYQYLLLNKASQLSGLSLTSPFNYLTTKKRLIMMTKNTSAKIALYKQVAIVPVLAAALIIFCHKVIAKVVPTKTEKPTIVTDKNKRPVFSIFNFKPDYKPHVRSEAPITIMFDFKKNIAAATTDAPRNVLDDYAAILKRYGLPYKTGDKIIRQPQFTVADREKIESLYVQMSRKQQRHQYIRIWRPVAPIAKYYATEKEFSTWKNADKHQYTVWLDGKITNNTELSKYKAADFDYAVTYPLPKDMASYVKFDNEVQLMTKAFYAKYCDEVLAEKDMLMYQAKEYWKFDDEGAVVTEDELDEINSESADAPQQNQQQNKTGAVKAATPPDFVFITKPIPPAKHNAPQSVLDEYAAILKKHNLPPDTSKMHGHIGITFVTQDADRLKLQDLFNQMSKAQQSKQEIQYGALELPSPKRSPSSQQLVNWQNDKKFRVWIDDKNASPGDIAKYKPEDMDGWDVAHLSETTNPNYKHHQYEVHLMTHTGYDSYYKQVVADRRQMPIWTVLRDKFNKRKAE